MHFCCRKATNSCFAPKPCFTEFLSRMRTTKYLFHVNLGFRETMDRTPTGHHFEGSRYPRVVKIPGKIPSFKVCVQNFALEGVLSLSQKNLGGPHIKFHPVCSRPSSLLGDERVNFTKEILDFQIYLNYPE